MNILEKSIRAIGGVFNERLLAYFKNYGATSNVLQDAEKEYLRGKGLTFGANQDAWKQLDGQYLDRIPLEVSDILKKYNATMLLPGVSGAMRFGYQPGNYTDSAGTILAAADNGVGRVNDAGFGGISATQATAGFKPVLRNTAGIQSWQFDGTDDRLSLSAVPFQMADDHFVVAGAARGGTGITRRLFHVGSAGDVPRVAVLSFSSNGTPELNYRNDAGTLTTISGSAPLGTAPVVISATSISTVINLRAESALLATGTRPSGATTLTSAAVGAHTAGGSFFNGHIHGVIFGKGAITDSELLVLERFVASLQGRTL